MANTFTLHIPAGHYVSKIARNGRHDLIQLAAGVTIDDATRIYADATEYRYEVGEYACIVEAAPLLTDSRVTVVPN